MILSASKLKKKIAAAHMRSILVTRCALCEINCEMNFCKQKKSWNTFKLHLSVAFSEYVNVFAWRPGFQFPLCVRLSLICNDDLYLY